ncbi:zinc finger protein 43 [Drosophila nasuta]|uniref:zinc finger protein 43 n=1 Tax=Drosophila nasuta TaxID=42062 RepID=UPI00295EAC14|nr:zinc finger protein 43 [Drosophila nasuta]XP_060647636.1 zinc finger protein 43 [Drosophila nasuta]
MCSTTVLCPLCAVPSFNSIDALQQRLIKAANGPLACPFPNCKELFLGLDKLTIHLFSHTSLMTTSTSETVAKTEPQPATTAVRDAASSAASVATSSPSTATAASKRRGKKSRAKAVEQAIVVVPPPITPPARCEICEFNFRNDELRDIHFRLVHENGDGADQGAGAVGQQQEPYKCHLCSKTFRMKGSLRVHLKVLHTIGCSSNSHNMGCANGGQAINPTPKISICDRIRHKEATAGNGNASTIPSSSNNINNNSNNSSTSTQPYALSGAICMLKQEITTPADAAPTAEYGSTPKNWECDVCAKLFTTKYFLKKHKRLHTGEMPYTCQFCARTFTFQQSYHKHLLYHSEVKPHACGICGRAFKELSTLHNHQRIHSGEKPFRCEVCGKCFRQRVSFLVHTRIHTGVMPYKCEQCQKTFRYKVSLRTHKCTVGQADDSQQTPEQLIKALLDSNGVVDTAPATQLNSSASPALIGIPMNGGDHEALLSQTIDDIVVESCQKLGICGVEPHRQTQPLQQPVIMDNNVQHYDGSNSPLQQMQNLRLYSPQQQADQPSSDGDLFRRFFDGCHVESTTQKKRCPFLLV